MINCRNMKNRRKKTHFTGTLLKIWLISILYYYKLEQLQMEIKGIEQGMEEHSHSGTVRISWKCLWLWTGYITTSSFLWWPFSWPTYQQKGGCLVGVSVCLFVFRQKVLLNCEITFTILVQQFGHLLLWIDEITRPLYISE